LRAHAQTVREIYVDAARNEPRLNDLKRTAEAKGVRIIAVDARRLAGMAGGGRHQGVVAAVSALRLAQFIDDLLEEISARGDSPLLLVLDGVQDPHNLGACLRVADAAGAHAVIAPKDRSCGLTAAAIKVSSGAAEALPYISVTNLARSLRDLKDRGLWLIGTDDDAPTPLYQARAHGPLAWVMGAEGEGMRRLTRELCDSVVAIPMTGTVESLNISVAAAVCLFETRRQRLLG
jgi:23S rRNA (guanosine2251-2'-O)-methyltransferase